MRRLVVLAVVAVGCTGSRPPSPTPPPLERGWRGEMLVYLNGQRLGRAGPLSLDHEMSLACQAHSAEMAERGRLFHAPGVWEVIAAGQRTPEEAIDDWLGSHVGHREILLDRDWTRVGFGVAEAGGRRYWTARFR